MNTEHCCRYKIVFGFSLRSFYIAVVTTLTICISAQTPLFTIHTDGTKSRQTSRGLCPFSLPPVFACLGGGLSLCGEHVKVLCQLPVLFWCVQLGVLLQGISQRVHGSSWADLGLQPLYCVLQRLPLVAEPDADHLAVIVQFLSDFRHLLAGRVRVFLEVAVEDLQGLRGERGPPLALFWRLAADKLGQVLHAGSVPGLGLGHPALQNGLNLLGAFWSDVQLLKPGRI